MDKIRVLLIDDEEEFTSALAERLSLRGIAASTSSSGEEALKMIESSPPPDVIILDLMMPGLSGVEILTRIKKKMPDVRVIFLTGHGSPEIGEGQMNMGSCEYLIKPVKIEDLIERIRSAAMGP